MFGFRNLLAHSKIKKTHFDSFERNTLTISGAHFSGASIPSYAQKKEVRQILVKSVNICIPNMGLKISHGIYIVEITFSVNIFKKRQFNAKFWL